MLRIQAITFNTHAVTSPIAADFDEMGGTIGRAEGNTLVLPDEKRYISRTQASIAFSGGSYVLRDAGSATPTFVNGAPVGNGNEVALREGDEIRIGDYVLSVSEQESAHSSAIVDPFADLLPAAPPAEPRRVPAPAAPNQQSNPYEDPFAIPARSSPPGPSAQPGVIPADFDFFAEPIPALSASPKGSLPDDDLNLVPTSPQNVDDLYGLKGGGSWDPLAPEDPLATPHSSLLDAPSTDPLAGLGAQSPQSSAPPMRAQRDHAPMLSGAFRPPQARFEQSGPVAAPPRSAPQPPRQHSAPPSNDMVVSWDTQASAGTGGEIKTAIFSPKRGAAQSSHDVQPSPAHREPPSAFASTSGTAVGAPGPTAAPQLQGDELLRAFLSGAGMTDLRIPGGVSPELMTLLGQLLHESIRGTLDLLLARALTKREVGAQATVIVARENNPLKFSPNVEAALNHLLTPQGHGFMTPASAMRDAYNDLRSHQFGFMAGMRAALEGVLARFDPAQLEQRLTRKGVLGSLLPSNRRAKLWELYEQLYRDISREAEDDFQRLFGKEFLRAYEAQIEKLEQEDAAGKR